MARICSQIHKFAWPFSSRFAACGQCAVKCATMFVTCPRIAGLHLTDCSTGHVPATFKSRIWLAFLLLPSIGRAQLEPPPTPEAPTAADWTAWQGTRGSAQIRARLRDKAQYAAQHIAAVEVEVQNVWLTLPAPVSSAGVVQAILRYQLDHCPPAVTTGTGLRFDQLSRGSHTITVVALGIDNRLLTPYATMHVKIP